MEKNMATTYLKNKDLLKEIIRCQDASITSLELVNMFYLISNRLVRKFYYQNPDDKDDVIQQGVMDCYQYWHNFDPSKGSNAFAYITQITKNGFAKSYKSLHKIPASQFISLNNIHSL